MDFLGYKHSAKPPLEDNVQLRGTHRVTNTLIILSAQSSFGRQRTTEVYFSFQMFRPLIRL